MGTKLEQLYTDILDYCSLRVDDQDRIVDVLNNDDPITIDGKTLIFPSQSGLKRFHPDKTLIFHPLSEYINRGESDVVRKLRYRLNITMNYAVIGLGTSLLRLVGSTALHKRLTPEQRQLLLAVQGNDVELAAKFSVWAGKVFGEHLTSTFVNLYLKKAGTYKGKPHARVGVVSFDFATRVEESKLKPEEKESFLALFRFMFPDCDDPEAYNNYSDSRDAPWLECLLSTSYNVTGRLNELIQLYADFIDSEEIKPFNTNWLDGLDNLDLYQADIRRIPSQRGNEGTVEKEIAKPAAPATRVTPAAPASQQTQADAQPAPAQPFVQHPAGHVPVPAGYPAPAGYPVGYPVGYPPAPAAYPQPHLQAPLQPAPGLQKTANGKLSFSSIEATNPSVAMAGMVQTGLTEWMHRQQMQPGMMPVYQDPRLAPSPNVMPAVQVPPGYQLIPSNFPPGYQIVPIQQQMGFPGQQVYPGVQYAAAPAPQSPAIRPI